MTDLVLGAIGQAMVVPPWHSGTLTDMRVCDGSLPWPLAAAQERSPGGLECQAAQPSRTLPRPIPPSRAPLLTDPSLTTVVGTAVAPGTRSGHAKLGHLHVFHPPQQDPFRPLCATHVWKNERWVGETTRVLSAYPTLTALLAKPVNTPPPPWSDPLDRVGCRPNFGRRSSTIMPQPIACAYVDYKPMAFCFASYS